MAEYAQFDVYLEDVPRRMIEIWNPQSDSGTEEISISGLKNISLLVVLKKFGQFIGDLGQREIHYLQIHLRQPMWYSWVHYGIRKMR